MRPSRAANVAAACRALKNMGLRSLAIVGTDPGLADPGARALAYGAWDLLDSIRTFETLREAVAESTFVAGTSGRPCDEAWAPRELAEAATERTGEGRLAVVFGPEADGLRTDELALCHVRVHIPTDPAQHSLNLAQAVLLVAYELRLAARHRAPARTEAEPATVADLEGTLDQLREALLAVGYLNPENPEAIVAEIRRLLARAAVTAREATLLRGMARQILWCARHVAPPSGPGG